MADTAEVATWAPTWTVGERIRKAREDQGWHQSDLAVKLHVSRATIAAWEGNINRPNWVTFKTLAELTDTPQWWLQGSEGPSGGVSELQDRRSRNRKPAGQDVRASRCIQLLPSLAA